MADKPIPQFHLDEASNLPLWVQIRERFVYLISSGYYVPGDQLPSVRKVASELRISYNTVSKAFMSLEREGHIVTKHGSGAYVAETASTASEMESYAEDFVRACQDKGMTANEIVQLVTRIVRRGDNEEE